MSVQLFYALRSFCCRTGPVRRICFNEQVQSRYLHVDGRNRLSTFWAPTGGISPQLAEEDDSHSLLIRGGFLRQAYSGVFHFLPLGLRVQEKLERLVDKHMRSVGASKVSLSSISSEELWQKSGRLGGGSELIRLKDRKESGLLLSPTHEEEITMLTASIVKSYKDLPLRLYQISRKYRDELRPRQGLLRTKEFLMKDLYTFDYTADMALETYESVRKAYAAFFDELKVPYLVADADSGAIGGDLSHEYHFVSPKGEDNVCACDTCDYVANEELAEKRSQPVDFDPTANASEPPPAACLWVGTSVDRTALVRVYYPATPGTTQDEDLPNLHAVKAAFPALDTSISGDSALRAWLSHYLKSSSKTPSQILQILDHTFSPISTASPGATTPPSTATPLPATPSALHSALPTPKTKTLTHHPTTHRPLTLTRITPGSLCPRCPTGHLHVHRAIEVGHTFHLGTRYSIPLGASVPAPSPSKSGSFPWVPLQMGCHGIGVSRLIGAVAAALADAKGLSWPRVIAPFEVVVVAGKDVLDGEAGEVYDVLRGSGSGGREADVDVVLDDRAEKSLGWKLKDADLIGYPVVVVMGKAWRTSRRCEVQCRRLDVKRDVEVGELGEVVKELLGRL